MGRQFLLDGREIVIGRESVCDLYVAQDSVSREHARCYRDGVIWMIEDRKSTNGTYINGMPVQRSPMRNGDIVKIGAVIFKFLQGSIESGYYEAIYHMTIEDALTGAYNKRYLTEALERELARCEHGNHSLGLIFFDIDHFKQLCDRRHLLCGDYVLQTLGKRLRDRLRRDQILARFGDAEFVIVLPDAVLEEASFEGEQIRKLAADEPFTHDGGTFGITVSVGVSVTKGPMGASTWHEIVKSANANCYRAKRQGRNCVVSGLLEDGPEFHQLLKNEINGEATILEPAKHIVHGPSFYCLPDRSFRDLLEQGASCLFAVDFRDRVRLIAERGSTVVDEVERAIERALFRLVNKTGEVAFGQLEEIDHWFVILLKGDVARAKELGKELEAAVDQDTKYYIDRFSQFRLLCGQPIPFESITTSIASAAKKLDEYRVRLQQYDYYLPWALAIRRCELQTQPAQRIESLIHLHHVVVRSVSAILLCEALELGLLGQISGLKALLHRQKNTNWLGVLRDTGRVLNHHASPYASRAFPHYENVTQDDQCALRFPTLAQALFREDGSLKTFMNYLDDFIEIKLQLNEGLHEETSQDQFAQQWTPRILQVCKGIMDALQGSKVIHIDSMRIDDDNDEAFSYRVRELTGDYPIIDLSTVVSKQRMRPSWVYLFDSVRDISLPMDPLIALHSNPRSDETDVLYLESIDDMTVEYRSLQTNAVLKDESAWTAPRQRRIAALLA